MINTFKELIAEGSRVDELYTAMLYMQSIAFKDKAEIPGNPARRLLKKGELVLEYSSDVHSLVL